MVRKAVDQRLPALFRNNIQEKKRSFIVLIGDRAKDAIVQLHYIRSSMDIKSNKSVLWAYKKELLGFTSHRKKRENKIKKEVKRGIREANTEDPFELFVSTQNIKYVYYKETERILGNTYGMCILQDFESLTPNLLARTIETVEGGGLVVMLLKGMSSLKQLYTLTMDVHSRYRTEAHDDVTARFNERFILSLGSCESCLVIDDELNVLPISGGKHVKALPPPDLDEPKTEAQKELDAMKEALQDTQPVGSLVTIAKTVDQAKALLTFVDAIADKTLKNTVTLTAARGRGKSAALGVAIAAAVAHNYSNIFITSPSPENLRTLFEFIFKGFDALGYQDHLDYSIIQSTNPDFNKAIVRVNIHRHGHRQTIQYIRPQDSHVLGQAELLVIDEAAAIPLPLVKKLMGSYLVFMASTINGYEGTGRSLSLKLIKELREKSKSVSAVTDSSTADRDTGRASKNQDTSFTGGRTLREITLSEPIRYAQGDAVEKWMNNLLCLDATLPKSKLNYPDPAQCELLQVNRDTLFSFNAVSEKFLQQMIALYVASHYKNTPDDLQLMSDAPAHQLYVLVPPGSTSNHTRLPEPLCVLQVALEGRISRQSVLNSLSRGQRAAGDLIPWTITTQFQDNEFASLSGARVVRIATNPDYSGKGYGSRAIQLLTDFYEGKFIDLSNNAIPDTEETIKRVTDDELSSTSLLTDDIKVRATLPKLFIQLTERRPDALDYLGVSYGLTQPLHKFWKRSGFIPIYLRQTPNELTGEHTCIMLRPLSSPTASEPSWLGAYARDFHRRFLQLLSLSFTHFSATQALSINESATAAFSLDTSPAVPQLSRADLGYGDRPALFTPHDLKRIESYSNNMLDYHVILDLVPTLSTLYFSSRLPISLTGIQASILLALGLQKKPLEAISAEFPTLSDTQTLAMFIKIMRKFSTHFAQVVEGGTEVEMGEKLGVRREDADAVMDDEVVDERFVALKQDLGEELEEAGDEATRALREKQKELIDALPLEQYEIANEAPWEEAEKQLKKSTNGVVSLKGSLVKKRKAGETAAEIYENEVVGKEKKRGKKGRII